MIGSYTQESELEIYCREFEKGGFCITPPKGIFHGSYKRNRDEQWYFY